MTIQESTQKSGRTLGQAQDDSDVELNRLAWITLLMVYQEQR